MATVSCSLLQNLSVPKPHGHSTLSLSPPRHQVSFNLHSWQICLSSQPQRIVSQKPITQRCLFSGGGGTGSGGFGSGGGGGGGGDSEENDGNRKRGFWDGFEAAARRPDSISSSGFEVMLALAFFWVVYQVVEMTKCVYRGLRALFHGKNDKEVVESKMA